MVLILKQFGFKYEFCFVNFCYFIPFADLREVDY